MTYFPSALFPKRRNFLYSRAKTTSVVYVQYIISDYTCQLSFAENVNILKYYAAAVKKC